MGRKMLTLLINTYYAFYYVCLSVCIHIVNTKETDRFTHIHTVGVTMLNDGIVISYTSIKLFPVQLLCVKHCEAS